MRGNAVNVEKTVDQTRFPSSRIARESNSHRLWSVDLLDTLCCIANRVHAFILIHAFPQDLANRHGHILRLLFSKRKAWMIDGCIRMRLRGRIIRRHLVILIILVVFRVELIVVCNLNLAGFHTFFMSTLTYFSCFHGLHCCLRAFWK